MQREGGHAGAAHHAHAQRAIGRLGGHAQQDERHLVVLRDLLGAQAAQGGVAEGLDEELAASVVAVGVQRFQDAVFHHRVGLLGLGVDAHLAAHGVALLLGKVHHLLEGRHREGVGGAGGEAGVAGLARAGGDHRQGLDLGQGEVGHLVAAVALRKERGHIGGAVQGVVVDGDQCAVFGDLQVGLDEVDSHADGQLVATQGVLGQVAAGTPVGNDLGLCGRVIAATATGKDQGRQANGGEGCEGFHGVIPWWEKRATLGARNDIVVTLRDGADADRTGRHCAGRARPYPQ